MISRINSELCLTFKQPIAMLMRLIMMSVNRNMMTVKARDTHEAISQAS